MRDVKPVAAGMVAVVAGGLLLAACDRKPTAGPPQMPPPVVIVAEAKSQDVPLYLDAIGKAIPIESATIRPRVDGQIVQRLVEDGAQVKVGQVLFKLDEAPFAASLALANASLAQAKAAQAFANIELDRYTAVSGSNAISKSDLDTKKNAVDVATAQVAAAEAAVRTAQINLDFCTIRSPINGRTGARMVDIGNVVKENDTALLSIQRLDTIYADFTVNEQQLVAVRENMAKGTLKTLVRLPADKDAGREGVLTFLDNSVQDATGTVRLRATLDNADGHFWPGQFVNVRLVLATLKDAVLVPSAAPQISQTGTYVLVVNEKLTAEMRPIVQGQPQGDWVVIDSGLKPGEKVITDGQLMVRPNSPVRLHAPATQPTQTAAAGGAK